MVLNSTTDVNKKNHLEMIVSTSFIMKNSSSFFTAVWSHFKGCEDESPAGVFTASLHLSLNQNVSLCSLRLLKTSF